MEPHPLDHSNAERVIAEVDNRAGTIALIFSQPLADEKVEQIIAHLSTHISGVLEVCEHEKGVTLCGGPWGLDTFLRHLQDVFSKEFWPIYLVTDQPKAA